MKTIQQLEIEKLEILKETISELPIFGYNQIIAITEDRSKLINKEITKLKELGQIKN